MIRIEDLWYTYAGRDAPTLKGINLEIADGEFVLLAGPTGCGKSTLLKTLNGIIPHESGGRLSGSVHISGINTANSCMMELAQITGPVFQNPDDQIFSTVVEDEIAFGPENLCLSKDEIDRRVRESLAMVGMSEHRFAPTATLSGGQKQRICIASMLAMMPRVMTLDEPISQLDPAGASEVMHIIKELNRRLNLTIVLVEHRLHEIAPLADRIILMDCGTIVLDEPVSTAFKHIDLFHRLGLRVPETVELCYRSGLDEQPLIVEDALELLKRNWVKRVSVNRTGNTGNNDSRGKPTATGDPVISIRNMWFGYRKDTMVLKNINLDIQKGERVALMGSNGSGKSTLLMHMPAMLKPDKGKIEVFGQATGSINPYSLAGRVGLVFQNPDLMLFCDSVYEEAGFGPANLGLKDVELRASRSLEAMQILDLRSDTPQALSRGQRLRTAVASVLSMEPELILLDEPTTGQDRVHIEQMMTYFTNNGSTLVFCTHDVETAVQYATRIIVLSDGCVIADGCAGEIFMDEEILKRASLKQPVTMEIAHGLGIKALFPEALC
jgi:energy-coupling factor transporter ATP-binding protein EcfA2